MSDVQEKRNNIISMYNLAMIEGNSFYLMIKPNKAINDIMNYTEEQYSSNGLIALNLDSGYTSDIAVTSSFVSFKLTDEDFSKEVFISMEYIEEAFIKNPTHFKKVFF